MCVYVCVFVRLRSVTVTSEQRNEKDASSNGNGRRRYDDDGDGDDDDYDDRERNSIRKTFLKREHDNRITFRYGVRVPVSVCGAVVVWGDIESRTVVVSLWL